MPKKGGERRKITNQESRNNAKMAEIIRRKESKKHNSLNSPNLPSDFR